MQGLQRFPQADDGADDVPDGLGDRDVADSQPHPNTKLILVPTTQTVIVLMMSLL